jgi:hypothetical protein
MSVKGLKLGFRRRPGRTDFAMITEGLLMKNVTPDPPGANSTIRQDQITGPKMHHIPEYCIRKALTEIDELNIARFF